MPNPPKPTRMRELEGNPGRRPLNENELAPTGDPDMPDWLPTQAAEEWERVINTMPPGVYTSADTPLLTIYCVAWAHYLEALGIVELEGMIQQNNRTSQEYVHPAVRVAEKNAEVILKTAAQLGMSPVARTKLKNPSKGEKKSKFAGLVTLRGGKDGQTE